MQKLVERVAQRLSLPDHQPNPQVVAQLVFEMGMEEQIVLGHREYQYVLPTFFFQERTEIGTATESLLGRPVQVEMPRVSDWISRFTAATRMQLSERQGSGNGSKQPVLILTGGPGTARPSVCELSLLYGKQWVNLLS